MPTLEQKSGSETPSNLPDAVLEQQQRRRMLIALAVLLLALISVLIKDRQFWFPASSSSESDNTEETPPPSSHTSVPAKSSVPYTPPKPAAPTPARLKASNKHAVTAVPGNASNAPVITATNRAVLPPLEVEVVAGNQHRAVSTRDGSVKVEMQPDASSGAEPDSAPSAPPPGPAGVNATAQVQLSPGAAQVVTRQVSPNYPLLAKQMKVQGAVVLEVLISKSGGIQDIQVVSGPAILSAAAREAVKQWHFKPYYQAGIPVETEARITVNFTISTY